MTNIRAAFAAFWGQFYNRSTLLSEPVPIPAYLSNYVVERNAQGQIVPAPFPRITFDVAMPEALENTILTASIWNRDPQNPGNTGLIDDVALQVMEAIPADVSGLLRIKRDNRNYIDLGEHGIFSLYRSTPFWQYVPDDDSAVTRIIFSYVVRNRSNL